MNKKQTPLSTLVASAKRLSETDVKTKKKRASGGAGTTSWQEDAWDMFDLVGEQRFLATNLAGQLAKAHLYIGKVTPGADAPERVNEETETAASRIAEALLDSFGSSDAGRSQILNRLAVNLFIPGEGWIVGIPPATEDELSGDDITAPSGGLMLTQRIGEASGIADAEEEHSALDDVEVTDLEWRMLSVSEVSINSTTGKVELTLDEGEKAEYSPDDLYLIRVWRPHPRKWWEADSPTRSSLPVLKELVGLTMHVSAQVDSRLAGAGVLVVPQSIQRSLAEQAGVDESEDQFTESLIESMLTPISDRASASAVVPLVVTAPDDSVDKIKHLTFSQPLDTAAQELRDEAIRRLALGQDAPPELLLGTGDMNHWGGWLVQSETVETHIAPVLSLICDALTTQFLWPALIDQGVDEDAAQDYVVWYDVDHLISRPNLGADSLALHERGVIDDTVLRRAHGFDDTDAPKETEQAEEDPALAVVLDMVRAAPSLAQTPGIPVLVEQIREVLTGDSAGVAALPGPEGDEGAENAGDGEERPAGGIPETSADPADLPGPGEG